jgi:uncharacterized protein (TIGR03067 family)
VRPYVLPAVAAALLMLGFAPAPLPKKPRTPPRDDLEMMQGVWRMTSYTMGGGRMDTDFKVRIRGKRWTFVHSKEGMTETDSTTWQLALNRDVQPRAFEWMLGEGKTRSGWVGSYLLEDGGRKLTVVFASGTLDNVQTRPTDFRSTSGNRMTFERLGR